MKISSIQSLLAKSWAIYKKHAVFLSAFTAIAIGIGYVLNSAQNESRYNYPLHAAFLIASTLFSFIAWFLGQTLALKMIDGEKIYLKSMLSNISHFPKYILTSLVARFLIIMPLLPALLFAFTKLIPTANGALIALFSVLLIAGGIFSIVVSMRLFAFSFAYIDSPAGARAIIKKTFSYTKGMVRKILPYILVIGIINLAGFLLFGVGLIFTVPTTTILLALVYRELSANRAAPAGLAN